MDGVQQEVRGDKLRQFAEALDPQLESGFSAIKIKTTGLDLPKFKLAANAVSHAALSSRWDPGADPLSDRAMRLRYRADNAPPPEGILTSEKVQQAVRTAVEACPERDMIEARIMELFAKFVEPVKVRVAKKSDGGHSVG